MKDVHTAIAGVRETRGEGGEGGEVVVPLVDNGRIEFAHLTDPLGNRFGIWHPKAAQ